MTIKNKKLLLAIYIAIAITLAVGAVGVLNGFIHAYKKTAEFINDPVPKILGVKRAECIGIEEINRITSYREDAIINKISSGELEGVIIPLHKYYYLLAENDTFSQYVDGLDVMNNNPGNLKFANQPEATKAGEFAQFKGNRAGFRALVLQLALDQSRDFTIEEFFTRYSPPFENDTPHLIRKACDILQVERTQNIKSIDTINLAIYMANQEHSAPLIKY